MSTQPGYRAARRRYGEYPSRDKWIQYLEDYTAHHRLDVRFRTEIERIDRLDGGWQIQTTGGSLEARAVVVATGFDHDPYMPDWPGCESFSGELIHASAYSDPEPFRGKDVLVVGPGVTGSEVAHLLAEAGAARVRVACRTPPHIIRRKWLGVSVNAPGVAQARAIYASDVRRGNRLSQARFGPVWAARSARCPIFFREGSLEKPAGVPSHL